MASSAIAMVRPLVMACFFSAAAAVAGTNAGSCEDSNQAPGSSLLQSSQLRTTQQQSSLSEEPEVEIEGFGHPSWLSSCKQIYLDVGTNKGVQIRKLFEPEKYPDAPLLPVLERIFGPASDRPAQACALGMEPNPHQLPRLQELESAYNARGFRTHIYPFAAWKEEGTMEFQTQAADRGFGEELGAKIGGDIRELSEVVKVRTVDLADFIQSLPAGRVKLMKIDIEGAEYETLAHVVPQNIMCDNLVPETFIETHADGPTETWQGPRTDEAVRSRIQEHSCLQGHLPTTVLFLDDETYWHDVDSNFTR